MDVGSRVGGGPDSGKHGGHSQEGVSRKSRVDSTGAARDGGCLAGGYGQEQNEGLAMRHIFQFSDPVRGVLPTFGRKALTWPSTCT